MVEHPVIDEREEVQRLFRKLKEELPKLRTLLARCSDHWGYDDAVYRFYHQSFKVFYVQERTHEIANHLRDLAPDRKLNIWFTRILEEGTGRTFTQADNRRWPEVTRPIVEAYFHAHFFLAMAVKSGTELDYPPNLLPSGWAALLSLYGLR